MRSLGSKGRTSKWRTRWIKSGGDLQKFQQNLYRVPQEECAILRENVPYVKVHLYNPKHLYPKFNGYGDNGERSLKV